MRLRHLFVSIGALAVGALVAGCHQSDVPLITPQPGLPCGNVGVPCYAQTASGTTEFTHECCWQGSVCGGPWPNVGCPADSCCAKGDDGVDEFGMKKKPKVVGKKIKVQS